MGMAESWGRTVDYLRQRKHAYQLTFSTPKLVATIKGAYRAAFYHTAGQMVLADLARFCRAAETCYHDDPRRHAVAEGRREVFLRIQNHLRLNSEQLFALYSGNQFHVEQQERDRNA